MIMEDRMAPIAATALALLLAVPVDGRGAEPGETGPLAAMEVQTTVDTGCCAEDPAPNLCPPNAEAWCQHCAAESWRISAGALFLHRRDPSAGTLMEDAIDGTEQLNAGDFDLGVHAGYEVTMTRRMQADRWAVEGRYFGIDHWNAASAAETTPGRLLQINAAPPVFVVTGTGIAAQLASEFQNAELNVHYRALERATLLAGFRYAELDEHFAADLVDAAVPFQYDTATRNRLYGFQLGTAITLWGRGGPLNVEGVAKAGIFGNRAAHRSVYETGVATSPARGTASPTALIGEIGAIGNYRFTNRWSLRGEYRLLWIDGVALAPEQVAASDFVFSRGIDAEGGTFYHGVFVGLQYVR